MDVVAGGGVRLEDVQTLQEAGVEGIHASCRRPIVHERSPLFDATVNPVDGDLVQDYVDCIK